MSFEASALEATQDILSAFASSTITLYPTVRADEISAFTGSGIDLSAIAVMDERPVVNDEGIVEVDNLQAVLLVDSSTAVTHAIRQDASSVIVDGEKYDIIRAVNDRMGQVACYLQKLP